MGDEDVGTVPAGLRLNLPFLWDLPTGGWYPELTSEAQRALSRQLVTYWTTFAGTGSPNAPGSVPWSQLAGDAPVQSLAAGDGGIAPVPFAENHHCDFWLSRVHPMIRASLR